MTKVVEGDIEITAPNGVSIRKHDDVTTHGLSHCMKAVDFIIEQNDRIYFIELKDPDNPNAQAAALAGFKAELASGQLDSKLATKFRDSYLYELASNRLPKPVYYIVLIGLHSLTAVELVTRTDALKKQLPIHGPFNKPWPRPLAAGCVVVNLDNWAKVMPNFPIRRLSAV